MRRYEILARLVSGAVWAPYVIVQYLPSVRSIENLAFCVYYERQRLVENKLYYRSLIMSHCMLC